MITFCSLKKKNVKKVVENGKKPKNTKKKTIFLHKKAQFLNNSTDLKKRGLKKK